MNNDWEETESEVPDPSAIQTIETILELIENCYETKQTQTAELELGGKDMGDSIVVTITYKGNKNANQSLN